MSGPWDKFAESKDTKDVPSLREAMPWAQFTNEKPLTETLIEAGGNIPQSAKGVVENIVQPIEHPVDTAENLANLFRGTTELAGSAVFGTPESEYTKYPKGVAKYFQNRYGSWENFKKSWAEDPVGVAMDLSLLGATGSLLKGANLAGDAGKIMGKAGALVDPLKAATPIKKLGQAGEAIASHTAGGLTGTGPDAIRQAMKAGYNGERIFLDYLENKAPLEDLVTKGKTAIGNMRKERNEQYKALKEAKISNDPTILDFDKIEQARQAVDDIGSYKGIPLSDSNAATRAQVRDLLMAWKQLPKDEFHTVEGFDALKKKLGSILDDLPYDQRTSRKYVADIKKAVSEEIVKQAPDYAKLMKDYAQASEGLEEIERAMSLGDQAMKDTGIRKLLSSMRNNANTNYGNRLKMVDALEAAGATGLKSGLAGAQMSSGMPRGLAGRNPMLTLGASLIDPHALAALPFESPALVGRGAYKIGELGGGIRDVLQSTILPDESVLSKIPEGTSAWAARLLNQAGKQP